MRLPGRALVMAIEMRSEGFEWIAILKELKDVFIDSYTVQELTPDRLRHQVKKFKREVNK